MRSTIGDIVARSARRTPNRTALVFRDRTWSYAQLDDAAARVAGRLRAMGAAKGDRVAAFGKNSDAYVLLWLACCKGGFIHVPVNFALTGGELGYILAQSGAKLVFADPALRADGMHDLHALIGCDDAAWEAEVDDGDLAQLLYTSGTTAAPKGAMLTHRALVHHYASAAMALDFRAADRPLHALPLYHSAQMHVFLMPSLAMGMENRLVDAPDPARLLAEIAAHRLTSLFAPPTVWIGLLALLEQDASAAASLSQAYYGASIMPTPVILRLRELLPQIGFYNCFGQSEIGPLATVLRPEEHAARPASAGRAVPFVELRVVDDALNDVEVGEVVYRSPQLCLGYWDKPEETAEAFTGGWFHSGDLAQIDAEGYITIVDRKKDIIKTGGVVVSSRDVEEALLTHPAVREVAVIPLPDPKWIEAVTAVVVLASACDEAALLAHAKERLAPFKQPKRIIIVDALPKNTAGKILKRVLRDRFG